MLHHCIMSLTVTDAAWFQLGVTDLSTRAAILHHTELARDEGGDMSPRPASAPPEDLEPPQHTPRAELEPGDKLDEEAEGGEASAPSAPDDEEVSRMGCMGDVWSVTQILCGESIMLFLRKLLVIPLLVCVHDLTVDIVVFFWLW